MTGQVAFGLTVDHQDAGSCPVPLPIAQRLGFILEMAADAMEMICLFSFTSSPKHTQGLFERLTRLLAPRPAP